MKNTQDENKLVFDDIDLDSVIAYDSLDKKPEPPKPNENEDPDETKIPAEEGEEEGTEGSNSTEGEEELEETLFQSLGKTLGYELKENAEYSDDEDGIVNFVKDASSQIAETKLTGLFSKYPEVQKFLDYSIDGGDPTKYFETMYPTNNYLNYQIAEDNVEGQKAIVTTFLKKLGHDDDFINMNIENFEDSGKLFTVSEKYLAGLQAEQQQTQEALIASQRQAAIAKQQERIEHFQSIADTLKDKNAFGVVSIPEKDKGEFFSWYTKPVGPNGETQKELDSKKTDVNQDILLSYIQYKGGIEALEKLIGKKTTTQSSQKLKELLGKGKKTLPKGNQNQQSSTKVSADDLDLGLLHSQS